MIAVLFQRFLLSRKGATAIEYALMAAAIALGLVVIAFVLGDSVETSFQVVDDEIANQGF